MTQSILLVLSVLHLSTSVIASGNVSSTFDRRYPQALIIGVKKCGTRALLEFLRLNPAIRAPGPEVHFFDKNYEKGNDWYRSKMPETSLDQVTIEKSPSYFISKLAPKRAYAFNPRLKLIVVVRNPITRAISDYSQAATKRNGSIATFEEMAVGKGPSWMKRNSSGKVRGVNAAWSAIRIGVFHRYLRKWMQYFPLSQIHIVDGEMLIANPHSEMRNVEKFLDINQAIRFDQFERDPVKGFPCIRRPNSSLHCLGKTKGRRHPVVRDDVLDALRRFYEPENENFYRLINRRFYW